MKNMLTVRLFSNLITIAIVPLVTVFDSMGESGGKIPKTIKSPQPLTRSQVQQFRRQMQQEINTDLDLAGLDKISFPTPIEGNLLNYRQQWHKIDPQVAPWLGTWVKDWDLFPPSYQLKIFPAEVKGRICLIAYQYHDRSNFGYPPGETIPPNPLPKLSIAEIRNHRVVGVEIRSDRQLRFQMKPELMKQTVEYLGVVNPQHKLQIFAAKSIPTLDRDLPLNVLDRFKTSRCVGTILTELIINY